MPTTLIEFIAPISAAKALRAAQSNRSQSLVLHA